MAFPNIFNKTTSASKEVVKSKYQFFVPQELLNKAKQITEAMKGQVQNLADNLTGRDVIGEPHPYDYSLTEGIANEFGLIDAFIDKLVNQVWGRGFSTKSDNENAKKIIDMWVDETGFNIVGRTWITTSIKKGTAYLELSGKESDVPTEIKTLNPQRMFIKRDDKGNVIAYRQKRIENGKIVDNKPNEFKPFEIACLKIKPANEDSAYGLGLIYPNLKTIDYFLANQKDLHDLIRRKANAPLVAYMGNKETGDLPDQGDIQGMGAQMSYMQSKTEWAVGANVKFEVIDFGDVGKNFDSVLRNDFELLMFGFQTPEALLGQGNVAEGLGDVQMDGYERFAQAIQEQAERIIENQIFKRVLKANKLDAKVEIVWGQPSKGEINTKITQLSNLLNNIYISEGLRQESEKNLAELLEINVANLTAPKNPADVNNNQQLPKVPSKQSIYKGVVVAKSSAHLPNCDCKKCRK